MAGHRSRILCRCPPRWPRVAARAWREAGWSRGPPSRHGFSRGPAACHPRRRPLLMRWAAHRPSRVSKGPGEEGCVVLLKPRERRCRRWHCLTTRPNRGAIDPCSFSPSLRKRTAYGGGVAPTMDGPPGILSPDLAGSGRERRATVVGGFTSSHVPPCPLSTFILVRLRGCRAALCPNPHRPLAMKYSALHSLAAWQICSCLQRRWLAAMFDRGGPSGLRPRRDPFDAGDCACFRRPHEPIPCRRHRRRVRCAGLKSTTLDAAGATQSPPEPAGPRGRSKVAGLHAHACGPPAGRRVGTW